VWFVNHSVIPHCYHGKSNNCSNPARNNSESGFAWANATGGYRAAATPVPTTGYPETSAAFLDHDWPLVSVPHDSVIGGGYNPNTSNPTHAYINRTVSW
jgi:hypothetical protein